MKCTCLINLSRFKVHHNLFSMIVEVVLTLFGLQNYASIIDKPKNMFKLKLNQNPQL